MTAATLPGRIVLDDVGVSFGGNGNRVEAVQHISFEIASGEFVCLLGPSGCGKSTLLNAMAGFIQPSSGSLTVDGEPVLRPAADRGMVFQHHSLFPWKTVLANVEFGLKMRGQGQHQRRGRARTFLHMVGLGGFERHYPVQLSGGMQQRVGIARVLVNEPRVMLMDEPFGALDAQTRLMMQELLLEIWQEVRTTVVFVTHDIDEAIFMADRIFVMTSRPGEIKAEVKVPLPRPRTPEVMTSPVFSELKRQCMAMVREESLRAMGGALSPGLAWRSAASAR
jgi:NitT/TauT family transport system ATP-binding protein